MDANLLQSEMLISGAEREPLQVSKEKSVRVYFSAMSK
jgi:hypothetical protein